MILSRISVLAITVLGLMACEPDPLPIHLEVAPEQLVISSLLIPQQGVTVAVTRTFSALNGNLGTDSTLLATLLVQNAEVQIVENRIDTFTLQSLQAGIYGSADISPDPGDFYHLLVTDLTSGLQVSAESTVTEQVAFSAVRGDIIPSGRDSLVNINFSFEPHPNEELYMVNVQKFSVDLNQDNLGIDQTLIEPRTFTHLVTKTDPEVTEISDEFVFIVNEDFFTGDTLIVSIASIEPTYFDYLEKRNNTRFGPSFVSEPYNAPTNVENGLGFFNLHASDNRIVIVE